MSRLEDLRELRDALRPQVLSEHSEHGLQGVSGLVGQYLKCLAEIEQLEKNEAPAEETPLAAVLKLVDEATPSRSSSSR